MLQTSVSLPVSAAPHWRENKRAIMQFAERFMRIKMRNPVQREVTRTYNRSAGSYEIVHTRFTTTEYDALHFLAASLRVSVSSLVHSLIKLWLKPARHKATARFCANYGINQIIWEQNAGILEESLTFWLTNMGEGSKEPTFAKGMN